MISNNQEENSSRNPVYTVIRASEIRYCSNWVFKVSLHLFKYCSNHSRANLECKGCSRSATFQLLTRRNAFHILVVKLRPCSGRLSSKRRSPPAGAHNNMPTRTPSAPYWLIRSIGSGELPRDLDILRCSLSRTIPVRYRFENGFSWRYS